MAGLSDYAENRLLDHIVGKTSFTMPTVYVGLYTVAPTDAGGGTEVSGGSYARKSTAGADWAAAASGASSNANALTYPAATANWGTIVAFGLFDAASGGNLLVWNNLTTQKTVSSGETAQWAAGDLDLTAD